MIKLRDYQTTIIDSLRHGLQHHNRVLGVAPTGSGKRYMACHIAASAVEKGRTVGIVTDRRILVTQMGDECRAHGIAFGLRMADYPRNDDAPVQICSIQTLKIRKWRDMPPADLWLIDEAHKTTESYFSLLKCYPEAKAISLTATPVGRNGCSLVGALGPIVEPYRNTDLLAQGWLLPTTVLAPSEPNLKGVHLVRGEYPVGPLGKRVEDCTVFADVFEWWRPFQDRQTIAFVPRVKFAYWLAEEFNSRGFPAAVVEGRTEKYDRKEILEKFANRELRVLVNVGVLVEGYDCPIASVGIDLTPNASFRNFWQKIGRVRRPYDGQEKATWLDFSGNIFRLNIHPDEDPDWPVGDTPIEQQIKKKREADPKEPWACSKCGYTLAPWEKLHKGICPQCGHQTQRAMRRIRMGNGQMREVPLKEPKKTPQSYEQGRWMGALFRAMYLGRTVGSAAGIFKKETGYWPTSDLRPMPPGPGHPNWKRQVSEVYPGIRRKTG